VKVGSVRPQLSASLAAAAALALAAAGVHAGLAPQYHLAHEVPLPGDGGWDDLTFEQGGHRLFIAHGTEVLVVDTDSLTLAGTVAATPGVHGASR